MENEKEWEEPLVSVRGVLYDVHAQILSVEEGFKEISAILTAEREKVLEEIRQNPSLITDKWLREAARTLNQAQDTRQKTIENLDRAINFLEALSQHPDTTTN